jgi:hypothetical protein
VALSPRGARHPISRNCRQECKGFAYAFGVLRTLNNIDKHRAVLLHVVKVEPRIRMALTDSRGLTVHIEDI